MAQAAVDSSISIDTFGHSIEGNYIGPAKTKKKPRHPNDYLGIGMPLYRR